MRGGGSVPRLRKINRKLLQNAGAENIKITFKTPQQIQQQNTASTKEGIKDDLCVGDIWFRHKMNVISSLRFSSDRRVNDNIKDVQWARQSWHRRSLQCLMHRLRWYIIKSSWTLWTLSGEKVIFVTATGRKNWGQGKKIVVINSHKKSTFINLDTFSL